MPSEEIVSIRANQQVARQCYFDSLKISIEKEDRNVRKNRDRSVSLIELDPWEDNKGSHP